MAHQGAKVSESERQELVSWIQHLEYSIYRLPKAELTLFLDIPVKNAQQLIAAKSKRTYTDKAADLQEADADYLSRVREVYLELANGPGWTRISCMDSVSVRSVEEIASDISAAVKSAISG